MFCFYVGQVIYTYSFEVIKLSSNIYFEFLVRMPIIMAFQSSIFYSMNYLTINNSIDTNIFVNGLYNLFINGILVRYIILLLCVKPYELIYNIKQKK